ncbi:hypothetical protein PTR25_07005 [Serratia nevei]|uniref:hypothetical protein n=1 Tax=Serratia nevei TaxID=2703794 RepID=UPI00313C5DB0
MAKLITAGITERDYYADGGVLEYELSALEVGGGSTAFENFINIKPYIRVGFELPPTTVVDSLPELTQILALADDWTRLIAFTYAQGGKVMYRQVAPNVYRARCEWG